MWKRQGARLVPLLAAAALVAGCDDDIFGSRDFLDCDEVRRIQIPATVNGSLTGSDCRLPGDGTPVDYYEFTLNSSRTVFIDMESNDVDSYLLLIDEDGFEIASDDDSGFGFDASLAVQLSSGRYYVAANAYDDEFGTYRLYIE